MGSLTPKMRYPELPAEGDLSFSVIKNKVTGIDLSSLVLDKGLLSITLNESQSNQRQYNINDCSLISISEGHSLDDNATLDFKYVFSVNKSDVYDTDHFYRSPVYRSTSGFTYLQPDGSSFYIQP
jgi:hypothetical protein